MHRRDFLNLAPAAGLATLAGTAPARAHEGAPGGLPGAQARMVGDISVTTISDGGIALGHDPLIGIEKADYDAIMRAAFRNPDGFRSGVNAFLIRTGDAVILVDAGTGGAFGPAVDNLPANLAATGTAPDDITHIVATHMHPDHVGGMAGDGGATFANAELVVHETERAFWSDDGNFAGAGKMMQGFAAAAQGVLAAYGDRLRTFSADAEIAPGVTAMPLPGHTPGHSGLRIASGDDVLLIWADIVHVAPVQLARPGVAIGFDVDPELAIATRRGLLDQVATDGVRVAGSHIQFPGVVNIVRDGEGYRAIAAPYDYDA